ncbi:hypothetical protein D9M68_798970 [compost metagenome]
MVFWSGTGAESDTAPPTAILPVWLSRSALVCWDCAELPSMSPTLLLPVSLSVLVTVLPNPSLESPSNSIPTATMEIAPATPAAPPPAPAAATESISLSDEASTLMSWLAETCALLPM